MKVLDTVALLADLPERGLQLGQVGVIVEELSAGIFEVEFADEAGRPYAEVPVPETQLLKLHHTPQAA